MSLRQTVRLEIDDGTSPPNEVTVTYDGRDLRAWEVAFGSSALTEDVSVSMLTWCGWHAAKRQGLLNGNANTYKAFDDICTNVAGVRDDPPIPEPATPPEA
jgi:hypothetical protein